MQVTAPERTSIGSATVLSAEDVVRLLDKPSSDAARMASKRTLDNLKAEIDRSADD